MYKKGFTLVELAIVIVIIGLLVGGVLQGQELVRQAQIRNFIKLSNAMQTAKITFFSKYNAIPGDLRNATKYFDATKCDALVYGGIGCNSAGANGGNNLVDGDWATVESESMRYWAHLQMANMFVAGHFAGVDTVPYHATTVMGKETLIVAANGSFWDAAFGFHPGPSTAEKPLTATVNYLGFFNWIPGATWDSAISRAIDAKSIDEKIDDGKPLTGRFLAGTATVNNTVECVVGTDYNMASDMYTCNFFQQIDN